MSYIQSAYFVLKTKIVTDHLDQFPNAGNLTIAKIIFRDFPEYFTSVESARDAVRYLRGAKGDEKRRQLKDKKYVKIQPSGEF